MPYTYQGAAQVFGTAGTTKTTTSALTTLTGDLCIALAYLNRLSTPNLTLQDSLSQTYTLIGQYNEKTTITFTAAPTVASISAISLGSSTAATITNSSAAGTNPFAGITSVHAAGVSGMTQINGLDMAVTATGGASGAWTVTVTTPTNTGWGTYTSGGTISPNSGTLTAGYGGGTNASAAIQFSDLTIQTGSVTSASTAVTWTGGLPATETTTANVLLGPCLAMYYFQNSVAGSPTLTGTLSVGGSLSGIACFNYSGIATTGALIASSFSPTIQISGNPAGANQITTENMNATTQPALVFGFCMDSNNTSAPTAGTSPNAFTGRATVWGSNAVSLPEDCRVLVTGNIAATFGSNSTNRFDTLDTVGAIFKEAGVAPISYFLESSEYF